jgi:hypothetical protein
MFVVAVSLPWVRLHIPEDPTTAVLGSPRTYATYEVRTYGFTGLQSATAGIVADWVILLGLVGLSWRIPRWQRPLTITAFVLVVLLVLVIFGLGRAIAGSMVVGQDLPNAAYPAGATTDYLGGAWFGLIGTVVLLGAVALPGPPQEATQAEGPTTSQTGTPDAGSPLSD